MEAALIVVVLIAALVIFMLASREIDTRKQRSELRLIERKIQELHTARFAIECERLRLDLDSPKQLAHEQRLNGQEEDLWNQILALGLAYTEIVNKNPGRLLAESDRSIQRDFARLNEEQRVRDEIAWRAEEYRKMTSGDEYTEEIMQSWLTEIENEEGQHHGTRESERINEMMQLLWPTESENDDEQS